MKKPRYRVRREGETLTLVLDGTEEFYRWVDEHPPGNTEIHMLWMTDEEFEQLEEYVPCAKSPTGR